MKRGMKNSMDCKLRKKITDLETYGKIKFQYYPDRYEGKHMSNRMGVVDEGVKNNLSDRQFKKKICLDVEQVTRKNPYDIKIHSEAFNSLQS